MPARFEVIEIYDIPGFDVTIRGRIISGELCLGMSARFEGKEFLIWDVSVDGKHVDVAGPGEVEIQIEGADYPDVKDMTGETIEFKGDCSKYEKRKGKKKRKWSLFDGVKRV